MCEDVVEDTVVKQGWLKKRAEHLGDWRARYFILKTNGQFIGFKAEPSSESDLAHPQNNFSVKNCGAIRVDRPKKNCFIVHCLHMTTVVQRLFHAESEQDRSEWIDAIARVKSLLGHDEIHHVEDHSNPFSKTGSVRNKSGLCKVTFENFEFLKVIGRGSFGKVVLCREKATSQLYAMKIMRKADVERKDEKRHIIEESKILQRTNHPFLLKLRYAFTTVDRLCIVTEYANGGEMLFHLQKERRFTEDRARFYGAEIVCAIDYLHQNHIIYRDLKLENILLDKDGHVKVADFGLCKVIGMDQMTNSFCGTPEYLAPEVVALDEELDGDEEDLEYGPAIDWWQLGVVLYEMVVGNLPFKKDDWLYHRIRYHDIVFPAYAELTENSRNLLSGLLAKNPRDRLGGGAGGAGEIKCHPFFDSVIWEDIENKKVRPPFKPVVKSETDTDNFDIIFTGEPVELTPPDKTELSSLDEDGFEVIKHPSDEDFSQFSYEASIKTNNSCQSLTSIAISA